MGEVVSDQTQSHPALHPGIPFVEATARILPPFENGDATLTTGPPFLPALFLSYW
jgi:hypothetical protein